MDSGLYPNDESETVAYWTFGMIKTAETLTI